MLSQLSTKHVAQLLECLRNSYRLACEFDLRPGLKFLVQKVAHTPVAVNLYKQAGASMVFYIHTLIKICANIPDLTKEKVRSYIAVENVKSNDNIEEQTDITNGDGDSVTSNTPDDVKSSNNAKNMSNLADVELKTDDDDDGKINEDCDSTKMDAADKNDAKISECAPAILSQIITENPKLFLSQLKTVCDELCSTYVDILYDKAGTSCVDTMADQQLFFLIAQPDDFPELPTKTKIDEKQLLMELELTQARLQGQSVLTQAVGIQGKNQNKIISLIIQQSSFCWCCL